MVPDRTPPAAAAEIDERMIERLVRNFYAQVREDAMLGPVFASRIVDWEPHLQRIMAFWSSVVLRTGEYRGQPMQLHRSLPIDADHFDRWLALFERTAHEVCPPDAAQRFIEHAHRIASSLEMGIAASRGVLLGRGERLRPQAGSSGSR